MSISQNIPFLISRIGDVTPATRSKLIEIIKAANKAGHKIRFTWGKSGAGEHSTGNAVDVMVNDEAAGDFVRNYVWANRKRLGLEHVIWEQHITSTKVQPGVRRLQANRGSPTENHYDHNHIKFLNGRGYEAPPAKQKPPKAGTKPPKTRPKRRVRNLKRGMKGNDVKQLQKELKRVFPKYSGRLGVDGEFGPNTEREIREFQQRAGLRVDGVVGPNTRTALKKRGARI